jgi:YbbR-like protein
MDFLRKYVFHNLALKLLSLASAVLLWNAVAREPMAEVAHTVPIEFIHVPDDLAVTSEGLPQAEIWVRGPQRLLREVNPADLHPTIDLGPDLARIRGASERGSTLTFEVNAGLIRAPREVEIVQVVPSAVHVGFDIRIARQVPIHPRVTGKLPEGIEIVSVTAEPPEASVLGPRQHVSALDAVITDPIDASGLSGSATFTVTAYAPDPLVRLAGPAQVHVTVTTGKAISKPGAAR